MNTVNDSIVYRKLCRSLIFVHTYIIFFWLNILIIPQISFSLVYVYASNYYCKKERTKVVTITNAANSIECLNVSKSLFFHILVVYALKRIVPE